MSDMPAVEVRGLTKTFGAATALDGRSSRSATRRDSTSA